MWGEGLSYGCLPIAAPGIASSGVVCGRDSTSTRITITPHPHTTFGDLPVDRAAVDAAHVEGNVGGGPFSTRVPFVKGSVNRVEQGPGGAFSHDDQYNRNAVDLGAAVGTDVLAGFTGVVAAATGGCASGLRNGKPISLGCNSGYGNFVLLKHADGTCALHAHLETITAAAGQQIARYTKLGGVGLSGTTYGPHLHHDRRDCASNSLPNRPTHSRGAPGSATEFAIGAQVVRPRAMSRRRAKARPHRAMCRVFEPRAQAHAGPTGKPVRLRRRCTTRVRRGRRSPYEPQLTNGDARKGRDAQARCCGRRS